MGSRTVGSLLLGLKRSSSLAGLGGGSGGRGGYRPAGRGVFGGPTNALVERFRHVAE
jgi:hypothetical protein